MRLSIPHKRYIMAITRLLIICCLIMSGLGVRAQNQIDLTLKYNTTLSRYEVYARPTTGFTQAGFPWGSAQITVVAPASLSNVALTVTAVAAGNWADNSRLYAPAAAPALDFHGIGSTGAAIDLTAGAEVLLFTFTIPGGGCLAGIRLFINGVDPDPSAQTSGGDFRNYTYDGNDLLGQNNYYGTNYGPASPTCSNACALEAPVLQWNR